MVFRKGVLNGAWPGGAKKQEITSLEGKDKKSGTVIETKRNNMDIRIENKPQEYYSKNNVRDGQSTIDFGIEGIIGQVDSIILMEVGRI